MFSLLHTHKMRLPGGARFLSPRRTLALVGAALTLLTLARILVLLIESYSTVWAERAADRERARALQLGRRRRQRRPARAVSRSAPSRPPPSSSKPSCAR